MDKKKRVKRVCNICLRKAPGYEVATDDLTVWICLDCASVPGAVAAKILLVQAGAALKLAGELLNDPERVIW